VTDRQLAKTLSKSTTLIQSSVSILIPNILRVNYLHDFGAGADFGMGPAFGQPMIDGMTAVTITPDPEGSWAAFLRSAVSK
jgi:hypothetical protein